MSVSWLGKGGGTGWVSVPWLSEGGWTGWLNVSWLVVGDSGSLMCATIDDEERDKGWPCKELSE